MPTWWSSGAPRGPASSYVATMWRSRGIRRRWGARRRSPSPWWRSCATGMRSRPTTCCACPSRNARPRRPRPPTGRWSSPARGAACSPRRRGRRSTCARSPSTTSSSASGRPVPARPTWPWPPPWMRSCASGCVASCWRALRWRPGRAWASSPGTCRPRSTPTCAPCTTRSTTWSPWSASRSCWSPASSRWRRWPSCADAPLATRSSSSTRRRTPPACR